MVEELLHYFCCFECNSLSAIGCVKGCSKHVSSVVAAAKYCSLTPCRFHPFSKHPNPVWRVLCRKRELGKFCAKPGGFCEKLDEFAFARPKVSCLPPELSERRELTEVGVWNRARKCVRQAGVISEGTSGAISEKLWEFWSKLPRSCPKMHSG